MASYAPIARLAHLTETFGPAAAAEKSRLLGEIAETERFAARDLLALHDTLCFLRAYPDNPRVLRATRSLIGRLRGWLATSKIQPGSPALADRGFPGGVNHQDFSLPLLRRLQERFPDCFAIDWERFDEQDALVNALGLLVTSGECQGLDDITMDLEEWSAACRPAALHNDLEFLLRLFTNGELEPSVRDHLYESCAVPVRYTLSQTGTGRAEIAWPADRIHYQKQALHRRRLPLAATARRPFRHQRRCAARAGEQLILLAQRALSARDLEIRTLSHANAQDVWIVDGGRGLRIGLIGVVPAYRDPLECHYCCVVLKNGVPIAYGPGTVSLGCCEIGINFFPEFRGAEVGVIYPQFLRALYQVLGARYFFLTRYGMGEGNPAAIRTGAFWFYRKLGFVPTVPEVEKLARQEERRMEKDPHHRSSPATLRRLSHTSVFLDLSRGACRPLALGAVGVRQSRLVATAFDGDRSRAVQASIAKVARVLGQKRVHHLRDGQRRAWQMLAPLVAMVPGLHGWSPADRRRMLRIIRMKGGASERGVDPLLVAHVTFQQALRRME